MRRLLVLIALVAGGILPVAGALGGAAAMADPGQHPGIGIRLVDAPVASRDNPRARVYIIDHVAPGDEIHRRIEVSNRTGAPARIAVYPAAADIIDGSFVGREGDTPNELSTWTRVGRPTLDLPDGGLQRVRVDIAVPADAPPGEQYAVVWAQVSSGAADGSGITQVSRVGIRVYLSVGPGGEPASDFTIESLTAARNASGQPAVQATIRNTGGRALDVGGTLQLTDGPGGLSAGPFPVTLGTTLGVRETEAIHVALDKELPNGPWKANLEVTSGLLTRTAQADLTFPDAGTDQTVTPSQVTDARWMWAGAAMVALIVLALLWWLLAPRRRRSASPRLSDRALPHAQHRKVHT